jgi:hypothetical protein
VRQVTTSLRQWSGVLTIGLASLSILLDAVDAPETVRTLSLVAFFSALLVMGWELIWRHRRGIPWPLSAAQEALLLAALSAGALFLAVATIRDDRPLPVKVVAIAVAILAVAAVYRRVRARFWR